MIFERSLRKQQTTLIAWSPHYLLMLNVGSLVLSDSRQRMGAWRNWSHLKAYTPYPTALTGMVWCSKRLPRIR